MHKLKAERKAGTTFKMWVLSVDAHAATLGHQQIQQQDHMILSSSDPDI